MEAVQASKKIIQRCTPLSKPLHLRSIEEQCLYPAAHERQGKMVPNVHGPNSTALPREAGPCILPAQSPTFLTCATEIMRDMLAAARSDWGMPLVMKTGDARPLWKRSLAVSLDHSGPGSVGFLISSWPGHGYSWQLAHGRNSGPVLRIASSNRTGHGTFAAVPRLGVLPGRTVLTVSSTGTLASFALRGCRKFRWLLQ
eukprot:786259-Rhodomonas_salina.1